MLIEGATKSSLDAGVLNLRVAARVLSTAFWAVLNTKFSFASGRRGAPPPCTPPPHAKYHCPSLITLPSPPSFLLLPSFPPLFPSLFDHVTKLRVRSGDHDRSQLHWRRWPGRYRRCCWRRCACRRRCCCCCLTKRGWRFDGDQSREARLSGIRDLFTGTPADHESFE